MKWKRKDVNRYKHESVQRTVLFNISLYKFYIIIITTITTTTTTTTLKKCSGGGICLNLSNIFSGCTVKQCTYSIQ
jgi:hypothetical protein